MRLPRRVPWASLAELDEVCSWIYTDENDLDAKVRAINRLAAWRATTSIPHALESALSILTVIVQDASPPLPSSSSSSFLSLRQAYATAIIRLVNGLVDPLQLGAYARSIASIAAQLDFPAWLVELRHAATHEDLPSIQVLRDAARDAMSWLLHHYFIPALNPSSSASAPTAGQPKTPALRPLDPLLAQYKSLLKTTTRDASLRTKYKPDITKVLRDLERWIAEAKIAANITTATLDLDVLQVDASDGDVDAAEEDVDPREWVALNQLCDRLLQKGGLIPVSRKKRSPSAGFEPSASLLAIWTPLLTHVATLHPAFPSTLTSRILAALVPTPTPTDLPQSIDAIALDVDGDGDGDVSYDLCAASWLNWLIDTFHYPTTTPSSSLIDSTTREEAKRTRRANVVASLVSSLGVARKDGEGEGSCKAARHLLKVLCAKDGALQEATQLLLAPAPAPSSEATWTDTDLTTMSHRLDTLLGITESPTAEQSTDHHNHYGHNHHNHNDHDHNDNEPGDLRMESALPRGWRLLDPVRDGWRPTPLGVSCFSQVSR